MQVCCYISKSVENICGDGILKSRHVKLAMCILVLGHIFRRNSVIMLYTTETGLIDISIDVACYIKVSFW